MHIEDSVEVNTRCQICERDLVFTAPDDYFSCRSHLRSTGCPSGGCVSRDRALAKVVLSIFTRDRLKQLSIHEAAPSSRGLTLWLREHCRNYVQTGYFPDEPFGDMVGKFQNEDLEAQTFPAEKFDLVLHLDVLEHLFEPFKALQEIFRTLKPGGCCIMTAPTYADRTKSEQVAFQDAGHRLRIIGEPEYHGNPQNPEAGALVTWRYGYDLPQRIATESDFDVEVRRWQSRSDAIMGPMTEVYLLTKPGRHPSQSE